MTMPATPVREQLIDRFGRVVNYVRISVTDRCDFRCVYCMEPDTQFGFISPHGHNFCESCNRVRVTAEGRLLLCLGQEHSVDLRAVLRQQPGDLEALKVIIRQAMDIKPRGHDFHLTAQPLIFRHMNATGG